MKVNKTIRIDRQSVEPAYKQLVHILRRQIAIGVYRPGSQLPPEAELTARFGVSSMTVRRAINLLIDQGVVSTVQGKGTYVRPMEMHSFSFQLNHLMGLLNDRERSSIKILDMNMKAADELAPATVSVTPGESVFYIRRLVLYNEEPIILQIHHLLYKTHRKNIESEKDASSLHDLLMGTNKADLKRGEIAIESYVLKGEEAKLLMVPDSSAAFKFIYTIYDFEEKAASWGAFICRGDKMTFTSRVGIWD